ncbi:Eco57I restriction-modification methylase [Breznakibacter xylanolyticus]|uniref:site-specific DNA-methyltransferase (adenine-specific) n=1 Tax=Breznakibacter xylanolyticus TaxID=990 RepID=A0A2W7NK38_9BACT|nr:TaqI-like C-terminal specificity domain-containing protein [Breznakibacter xylanolyticus]PZX11672.1 Eco57I restriction-modification methylase [Breznakibacter xylanolyticus]
MKLNIFHRFDILAATKALFADLKIPVNYVADEPTTAKEILQDTFKENETFQLINDVYFVGMVDDAAFNKTESIAKENIKSDYDGILLFAITLHQRNNDLLPSRSQLAEISRAFNREFYYTPVVIVFKYKDSKNEYVAFSNTERLPYKQAWREGEKAGKVSLLRDINIEKPHAGHERIIEELRIPTSGKNAVDSFDKLYKYWQEVFSVSILNKRFYQELQSWYFWAIKEVAFPNAPMRMATNENGEYLYASTAQFEDAIKEHKGKNVIRLLTRILFIWFIKEKKLIPDEIFDEEFVANNLLKDFTPQKPLGIFATGKHTSMYYRAILQNLFFATLNQEMGKREFRKKSHMNVTNLMRYQDYFKDGGDEKFVQLMESVVPFMNGGLFECLDKPHPTAKGKQGGDLIIYEDGFSDRIDNVLQVPDYLFFDVDEEVDISDEIGSTQKIYKQAKTKGLLELLKSYKFTITENTPIEEDVALDPELLGKVFENLLASYNPETKTTARKQTGSFYTPREIVNYMVDESLIAHLKNSIADWQGLDEKQVDESLHTLVSFDNPQNPFAEKSDLQTQIIKALDACKILDPACGSGAFPMGILQKMVHILHKVDANNSEWKQRQIDRVNEAIEKLEDIDDVDFRERSIKELEAQKADIEESFNNNELDYGRKLYLIENCIYGVDIQSIATQISKLRFFISLVVDQNIDRNKPNFGVRPLPNLETKFVAANTLIGIDKPEAQGNLFDKPEVKKLEDNLKKVRHKLFSSKSPKRKRELRNEDKELREQISDKLIENGLGNDSARLLSSWDPYDQNAASPFFDKEWMFDITDGFDIVIGNPPYGVSIKGNSRKNVLKFLDQVPDFEIYYFFIEIAKKLLSSNGVLSYIIPNTYLFNVFAEKYREKLMSSWGILLLIDFTNYSLFEGATVRNSVFVLKNNGNTKDISYLPSNNSELSLNDFINQQPKNLKKELLYSFSQNWALAFKLPKERINAISEIKSNSNWLAHYFPDISQGLIAYDKYQGQEQSIIDSRAYHFSTYKEGLKKWLWGEDVTKYKVKWNNKEYIDYCDGIANPRNPIYFKGKRLLVREITNPSIFAAITVDELYNDPAIIIVKESNFCIEVISLILNSSLGTFYHFNASPKATKGDFPKILVKDIKEFPISKNITTIDIELYKTIHSILEWAVEINRNNKVLYSIVDGLIFNLYFPVHMQELEIDITQFIKSDMEETLQNRNFSELQNNEKTEVIETLQKKWSHPDNEVRNRIKLFAVRSPEILKPILES